VRWIAARDEEDVVELQSLSDLRSNEEMASVDRIERAPEHPELHQSFTLPPGP
jgi:hypothetical protein